jgi:hypothetical protein
MVVGRFQVMSLLQAARAYVLVLPLESAYSWGLNRGIFIAVTKRGFKGGSSGREGGQKGQWSSKAAHIYYLGDDMAYKTEKGGVLRFTIGGKVQTKEDFERQVKSRFGAGFKAAWREALSYVNGFDRDVLLSAGSFYSSVYRPVRDQLAEKWSAASEG